MRYAPFLKEGGTIGFVAPSFGCATEPYITTFKAAQQVFLDKGYQLDLGPNCYEGCGIGISNTPQLCGEELNTYFAKENVDVILSCGGGELMCEDLEYVDFERISKLPPKWYMGFSDNTNMTFLLTTLCDTASIYGPCAPSFGMKRWHPVIRDAWEMLHGRKRTVHQYPKWERESKKNEDNPLASYNVTEPCSLTLPDGPVTMEGRLIGGCMDCLDNLLGTSFDKVQEFCEKYKEDGIVWFLEACDLNPMAIRRALWQMKHAGWFKYVKGFILGRPLCYGEELIGLDWQQASYGILKDFGVPIILDADLGHLPPSMPLICGSYAKVTAKEKELTIKMLLK